jgi:anti-sigma factor RsiW
MSDDPRRPVPGADDPPSPRELLSAYLDGELDAPEVTAVERYLAGSADGRADLEALTAVRLSIRDLGPVEPPAGFFERLLDEGADDEAAIAPAPSPLRAVPAGAAAIAADGHADAADAAEAVSPSPFQPAGASRPRTARAGRTPVFGRVAVAVGAAAAAVVLLLGVTPLSDSVVPPVQAYAARHDEMMAAPPLPGPDGSTTPTTEVTSTSGAPGTASVATEPSTSTTTTPAAARADAMGFAPMAPAELDSMDAPYVAPDSMRAGALSRMAAYHSTVDRGEGGVLHLMYTNGEAVISVYEQEGAVRWDALPAGTTMTIGGDPAWAMSSGGDEVLVLARGPIVYTVVATAPHDMMMGMVDELPRPAEPSMPERAQAACRTVVVRFGLGD